MWTRKGFGNLITGEECSLFSIETESGVRISMTDYGLSLVSLTFTNYDPHRDVLLGFDDVSGYEAHDFYSGCIVGRVASRIGEGKFQLDGKEYQLSLNNNGDTHLHGGFIGLSKVIWNSKVSGDILHFTHTQIDGTDGYPGNLTVSISVSIKSKSAGGRVTGSFLAIDMHASCDAPTPINLTFHPYFNMDGHASGSALENKLTIFDYAGYLPMDPDTILPTGEIVSTKGSPFNLDVSRIGDLIVDVPGGYDHTFHLCSKDGFIVPAAEIESKDGKYRIRILTDQPGIHVYSGNFLNGSKGKNGSCYDKHSGIALEAQNFPNAVNISSFPDCILQVGEEYKKNITFSFMQQ